MIVSAISEKRGNGYNMSGSMPYYGINNVDKPTETAFNSTPNRKSVQRDKMQQVLDNINEWQSFCNKRILGQKLDVMA